MCAVDVGRRENTTLKTYGYANRFLTDPCRSCCEPNQIETARTDNSWTMHTCAYSVSQIEARERFWGEREAGVKVCDVTGKLAMQECLVLGWAEYCSYIIVTSFYGPKSCSYIFIEQKFKCQTYIAQGYISHFIHLLISRFHLGLRSDPQFNQNKNNRFLPTNRRT